MKYLFLILYFINNCSTLYNDYSTINKQECDRLKERNTKAVEALITLDVNSQDPEMIFLYMHYIDTQDDLCRHKRYD